MTNICAHAFYFWESIQIYNYMFGITDYVLLEKISELKN
ncbi:hypothetical protein T4B_6509, partial [Trichinella pseudospiralis]